MLVALFTNVIASVASIGQVLCLYGKKVGLNRRRSTKAPQQRSEAKHQLPFDCRLCIIVSDHRRFEGPIILLVLDLCNNSLGGQSMAIGIAAG